MEQVEKIKAKRGRGEEIVEYVRQHPGTEAKSVAVDLGITIANAHVLLLRLYRIGRLTRDASLSRYQYRVTA